MSLAVIGRWQARSCCRDMLLSQNDSYPWVFTWFVVHGKRRWQARVTVSLGIVVVSQVLLAWGFMGVANIPGSKPCGFISWYRRELQQVHGDPEDEFTQLLESHTWFCITHVSFDPFGVHWSKRQRCNPACPFARKQIPGRRCHCLKHLGVHYVCGTVGK